MNTVSTVQDAAEPVLFYERRFYPFSNFSSFAVKWRGRLWMTSEHAYQAARFENRAIKDLIAGALSAHDARRIAHQFRGRMIPDWDKPEVCVPVMEDICEAKLLQHDFIQKRLRETGDREIIEDSDKDPFWGWGPHRDGHNHLGKIWMRLRVKLLACIPA